MASRDIVYKNATFKISYEIVNPKQEESIVILHGWGSTKEIMKKNFENTLGEYKHIYIDMPGFGKSSNDMILHTTDYANIIQLFLDNLNVNAKIAMGHSFGGKVSTLLKTEGLVLLSSAGIVVPKPFSVKLKIKLFKLLKPLGATKIRKLFISNDVQGMSAEMYGTFKNVVDEDFTSIFSKSNNTTLCFWGKEDSATPLYTGEKISNLISNSAFYSLDGDHFFFTKHNEFIGDTISRKFKNG